jgi:hypothetical protein
MFVDVSSARIARAREGFGGEHVDLQEPPIRADLDAFSRTPRDVHLSGGSRAVASYPEYSRFAFVASFGGRRSVGGDRREDWDDDAATRFARGNLPREPLTDDARKR